MDPCKTTLSFPEIRQRLDSIRLPKVESVVGIHTGGAAPAILCADRLEVDLFMLPIHYRDENNQPELDSPQVESVHYSLPPEGSSILLVDDVSVSGSTFRAARALLRPLNLQITSLVLKGQADIVLFPEIQGCVNWPWNP